MNFMQLLCLMRFIPAKCYFLFNKSVNTVFYRITSMFMVHLMAFYGKFRPKNEETVTVDEEEEEVDSNLQSLFDKACAILPSYLNTTSTKDKLYLYGRYKFANDGPCDKKNKPSFYSVFGEKSKYDSWEEATAKCPTKSIAMKQYVYQIEKIIGKPIGEANVEGISKSLAHKPSVMVYEDTDHLPENASVNEKTFDLIVRHIRKNDVDGVKKLIEENSIMLHYIDENMGMSVFHIAVDQGSVPLCKMILKLGADINQVDNEGQTALEIALDNGHQEVADLLCDPDLKSKSLESEFMETTEQSN